MTITLNGTTTITHASTVSDLLIEHHMQGKPVLVEVNQKALVASVHLSTSLAEGDQIEFFVLGAGG